jgi:hypothetical protein
MVGGGVRSAGWVSREAERSSLGLGLRKVREREREHEGEMMRGEGMRV